MDIMSNINWLLASHVAGVLRATYSLHIPTMFGEGFRINWVCSTCWRTCAVIESLFGRPFCVQRNAANVSILAFLRYQKLLRVSLGVYIYVNCKYMYTQYVGWMQSDMFIKCEMCLQIFSMFRRYFSTFRMTSQLLTDSPSCF